MSDEEIKDVLQEVKKRLTPRAADGAACPDCKVLVFEGEETYFYCARHQPIKESE